MRTQLYMIKCLWYHKKQTTKLTCTMVLRECSEASTILCILKSFKEYFKILINLNLIAKITVNNRLL